MKQFTTRNTASVWILCSNELSNCMESDSLEPVLLQIPSILSLLYTNMSSYKQFHMRKLWFVRALVSYSNTIMAVTRKRARRERSRFTPSVWGQLRGKWETSVLFCFFESLFTDQKQHWMDRWSSYLQFCDCWLQSLFLMNTRSLFRFS